MQNTAASMRGEVDIRSASEAMQKAAEAMIAATESFRRQFVQEDLDDPRRPMSYHPYRPLAAQDGQQYQQQQTSQRKSVVATSYRTAYPAAHTNHRSRSTSSSIYHPSRTLSIYTSPENPPHPYPDAPLTTPIPPAAVLPEPLPGRVGVKRATVDPDANVFGARVVRRVSTNGHHDAYQPSPPLQGHTIGTVTPTTDWPVLSGSTPNLAATLVGPAVPGRPSHNSYRDPSTPAGRHIDLFEATHKRKTENLGLVAGRQTFFRPGSSGDDVSPVVQIGGYTYTRSDTDDFRIALINAEHPSRVPEPSQQPGGPGGQGVPSNKRPYGFSLGREIAFVWMVCVAQMLMLAALAQALVPAHVIGASFPNTTFGDMAWYSAAYGLTSATFVLPAGRLGDLFGHKMMFVIGFIWFGAWSLACGFADLVQRGGYQGTVFFCVSRAFQGIGPALLVPNGQAMLGRGYKPGPRKNMVMCLFGAAAPLGFVLGAVASSVFAQHASWPWAFWTLGAVCIALAAIGGLVMPNTEVTRRNVKESLWAQLDAGGMILGVAGLVLFNFAINQAPIVSWGTPYTYFILVIGVLLITAFIFLETLVPHPLVPVKAMKSSTVFVLACTATGWGCFSVWVFYAILFLQNLRGWGPLLTSAAFAPAPISGLAASLLTGYLMTRIGPPWIMFISMCAFFLGSLLLTTAPVDQSYWFNTFFGILIMPFGMDMSNPAAVILLSNSVSKEHQGIAASLVVTAVNYAISIALGFAGTVEVSLHDGGADLLAGYRGAQYFGMGLGGLGALLGAAFLLQNRGKPKGPSAMPTASGGPLPEKV